MKRNIKVNIYMFFLVLFVVLFVISNLFSNKKQLSIDKSSLENANKYFNMHLYDVAERELLKIKNKTKEYYQILFNIYLELKKGYKAEEVLKYFNTNTRIDNTLKMLKFYRESKKYDEFIKLANQEYFKFLDIYKKNDKHLYLNTEIEKFFSNISKLKLNIDNYANWMHINNLEFVAVKENNKIIIYNSYFQRVLDRDLKNIYTANSEIYTDIENTRFHIINLNNQINLEEEKNIIDKNKIDVNLSVDKIYEKNSMVYGLNYPKFKCLNNSLWNKEKNISEFLNIKKDGIYWLDKKIVDLNLSYFTCFSKDKTAVITEKDGIYLVYFNGLRGYR